ncbi:MAG: MBL fold metallo-hydrolase [Patescibacteria group bacterium]
MDTRISVQFLGGVAGNLTGSCVLLTVRQGRRKTNILIDCGLIQGGFKDSAERNREILSWLTPKYINYIVLTHSHVDHVGRLPLLVKNGFGKKGRIICTEATSRLLGVMLRDSAKIQILGANCLRAKLARERAKTPRVWKAGRVEMTRGNYDKKKRKGKYLKAKTPNCEPLYTMEDVEKTYELVKNGGFGYKEWIRLDKGVHLKLYSSGHVLGGAICVIKIETKTGDVHLGFCGDLGREDGIILPPPEFPEEKIDWWVTEGTYGGKIHPPREEEIEKLLALVKEAKKGKKKIVIPSFALERAQEIIYLLSRYMRDGTIPEIPIYLDSPMAAEITRVFAESWSDGMFNDQIDLNFNPFDQKENPFFRIVTDLATSVELAKKGGPHIVIAGSGMCEAGRVREYLRHGLGNSQTIVCLVGYMAENSLGRRLKNGLPIVKMNGKDIVVRAKIASFDSFSAHADSPFLVSAAKSVMAGNSNERARIFIVHAEEEGAAFLQFELLQALPGKSWLNKIIIPKLGEEVILY